jgi:FG-GAP repeat
MIRPRTKKGDRIIGLTLIAVVVAIPLWILHSCLPDPFSKYTEWHPQSIVFPSDGRQRPRSFGSSVAVDGNTIVVGSPHSKVVNGKNQDAGAAYVYVRKGNQWIQQSLLISPESHQRKVSNFAYSIDISANTIAILAAETGVSDNPLERGSIYIFTRQGDSWTQKDRILLPEFLVKGKPDKRMGGGIAIDGNSLVVGGTDEAYIFERKSLEGNWTFKTILALPAKSCQSTSHDKCVFGGRVDISGDTVVVGSGSADPVGWHRGGHAHVFVRNPIDRTWVHQIELRPSQKEDWFGASVAIHQDTVVVGIFDDVWGAIYGVSGIGGAYVYHRNEVTQEWTQEARLVPREGFVRGFYDFGAFSATNGTDILLGTLRSEQQAVYRYSRNPITHNWEQKAKITADVGKQRQYEYLNSVAASDEYLVIGDPSVSNDQRPGSWGGFYVLPPQVGF